MVFSTQLADRGIRVHAIMPDLVESRDLGWPPESRAARERQNPLGIPKPQEVGEAVRYLASPAAQKFSGTILQLGSEYQRGGFIV